jgi:hypothetical protein
MAPLGILRLRNRSFLVTKAFVARTGSLWTIEIETLSEDFDGEHWQPYLYHQGLRLDAVNASDLQGERTAWSNPGDRNQPHPELGVMYVFGHEPVYNCALSFGSIEGDEIPVTWSGLCDVHWDAEFGSDVPFAVECRATVKPPL